MTTETLNQIARVHSRVMYGLCVAMAFVVLGLIGVVLGYLIYFGAGSFITQGLINWDFFTKLPISPGNAGAPGGMKNGLLGTVMLVAIASAVAIPVGMLAGIYLSEYDTDFWMTRPVRLVSDVLVGVPSILLGILGYELLVVPMGRSNGWAGALALAMIMIPMVVRSTEQMLRKVPDSYRDASIALGASKAMTIFKTVIPSATGSIVTGIMLAIARAAGETAPLIFIAVGSRFLEPNPNRPFPSLTALIFDFAGNTDPAQRRLAWSGIFLLISLIFILNLALRIAGRGKSPQ